MSVSVADTRKPLTVAEAIERRDHLHNECAKLLEEMAAQEFFDTEAFKASDKPVTEWDPDFKIGPIHQANHRLFETFSWLQQAVRKIPAAN